MIGPRTWGLAPSAQPLCLQPPQRELKTMALADDLAYMTATEMAARIRRRQLSPVEIVDAVIERIEERNPSLNAFVFKGFDDARQRAEKAEHAVVAGEELGSLHGVPIGDEGPVRLQAGLAGHVRRRARAQGSRDRRLLRVRRARREGRRDPDRQDEQPGDGLPRRHRQLPLRPDVQSVRHGLQPRRLVRAAARPPSRTGSCRSPRAPTAAARSASRRPGRACTATRRRSAACRWSCAPTPGRDESVHLRGAADAHGRGRGARR